MLAQRFRTLIRSRVRPATSKQKKRAKRFVSNLNKKSFASAAKKQDFYINPDYRDKKIVLGAGEKQTLPILICYPRDPSESRVNLLIKNDYSNLVILPVTATTGKINLIVNKVIYVNDGATTSVV